MKPHLKSNRHFLLLAAVGMLISCSEDDNLTTRPAQVYGYGSLTALAVCPDGQHFVTAGDAGAFLWDLKAGRVVQWYKGRGTQMVDVEVSSDGTRVLTGGSYYSIRSNVVGNAQLWDATSGELLRTFDHDSGVTAVAFSPQPDVLVSQTQDAVRLWDAKSGHLITILLAAETGNRSVAVSPDARHIAIGGWTNAVSLYDVAAGELAMEIPTPHSNGVLDLAFSPDGTRLVAAGNGGVFAWNPVTGAQLWAQESEGSASSIAFSDDGTRLLTTRSAQVHLRDAFTGEALRSFGASFGLVGAGFLSEGQKVLTAGPRLDLWDTESGERTREYLGHNLGGHGKSPPLAPLALSPDGRLLLTEGDRDSNDRQAVVWDVQTGQMLLALPHNSEVTRAVFSPDNRRLATSEETGCNIWSMITGELLLTLNHPGFIESLAFPPDGSCLLIGAGGRAGLWDPVTGDLLNQLEPEASSPAFSQDGARILGLLGQGRVGLWEARSGVAIGTLACANPIHQALFSPDGTEVLCLTHLWDPKSAQELSQITLWNTAAAVIRWTQTLTQGFTTSLAFAPDGQRVLVCCWREEQYDEGPIRTGTGVLLDTATGAVRLVFEFPRNLGEGAFSPDGKLILTADRSGVRLWEASTGRWLRSFEATWWARFLPNGRSVLAASAPGCSALWDIRDILARPTITGGPDGTQIAWQLGTLQYGPTVEGAWQDLPAASPMPISPIGEQGFFRVRIEDDPGN